MSGRFFCSPLSRANRMETRARVGVCCKCMWYTGDMMMFRRVWVGACTCTCQQHTQGRVWAITSLNSFKISPPPHFSFPVYAHPIVQSGNDIGERMHADIRLHDIHHATGTAARSTSGRSAAVRSAPVHDREPVRVGWCHMAAGIRIRNPNEISTG